MFVVCKSLCIFATELLNASHFHFASAKVLLFFHLCKKGQNPHLLTFWSELAVSASYNRKNF